ncbi:MAG: CRTAC1 family protein [Gammaproteobacteria bacterium]|nr:MAG: CRTAC1 family protein [Gammaproteobacteria bacterium]
MRQRIDRKRFVFDGAELISTDFLRVTVSLLFVTSCGGGGSGNSSPGATVAAASPPAPIVTTTFADVTAGSGISYQTGFANPMANSDVALIATSAAAAGDYDNDGDIDLFIVRGDIGPNLLYRNDGNLEFQDVAASAGLAFTKSATENYRHSGVTFADMDGDGDLDLFMGGLDGDPSKLFRNNGDGTFSDVTTGSGIDVLSASYNLSTAFGDYDLDGDLDLSIAHWGTPRDYDNLGDTEHLWRNDSDLTGIRFSSVSVIAGISPSVLNLPDPNTKTETFDVTFTPTFTRIDDDLYPDLLMVGDFNRSQVFINNGDGTFDNVTDVNVIVDGNGMGSAVGDYDNDGDNDWFVSSIFSVANAKIGNRLYRNHMGAFEDVSDAAGIQDGAWGWGSCFMDFENDGDLDIYHTNGWASSIDASRAFVNSGDGTFVERAEELGIDDAEMGRGVICADFDNDGDVDIFLLHERATLWENQTTGNNYLRIKLRGAPPNTEAAGARILLTSNSITQLREIMVGSNFVSQNPTIQVFGLGTATEADVVIEWPDGQQTAVLGVAHGQTLEFEHPDL